MLRIAVAALAFGVVTPAVAAPAPPLVIPAQATPSYQITELEERIRELNGKVEDMTFQLLQLQEGMRKMQEDYELRFQELEDKQGAVSGDKTEDVAKADDGDSGVTDRLGKPDPAETTAEPSTPQPQKKRDLAPRALGTLTFDADGNVIDADPSEDDGAGLDDAPDAAQFGATPSEVIAVGKQALETRDYPRAEAALSAALAAWPDVPQAGEAQAALGEAQFWQKKYYDAAQTHLAAHNEHPKAPTAPDNLLGLGLALAGLNQREVACATYAEVLKQYPDARARLGERIKDEQAAAKCG